MAFPRTVVPTLDPNDLVDLYEALELVAADQTASDPLSPLQWAEANATVVLPTEGRQPFKAYPYQADLFNDINPRRVVLKARQTGMSNAIAIEALHLCLTRPDSTVLFVSRSQKLAAQLVTYCRHTINGMAQPPTLIKENMDELAFPNGSRIISLPASPSTGRGFAATRVYLDEFAFCEYDSLIYESIVGTVSTGGGLTVLSTPNGRANMFFRVWSELEGGEWSRHRVHWTDCPRYDEAWEKRTRNGMTVQSFAQEYDLDFALSGDAVFNTEDLALCKSGWNPSPEGCEAIVTGWDIGRRRDHTVGISLGMRHERRIVNGEDGQPKGVTIPVWHVVEYARVLEPYPVIQNRIDDRHRRLKGRTVVESNGVGDPVIENLTVRVSPYTMTAKTKTQAIQALQLMIQQGRLKHDIPQLDREMSLYQWDDKDLIQDTVMACSIAAITAQAPVSALGAAITKTLSTPHAGPSDEDRLANRRATSRLAATRRGQGWS